MMSIVDAKLRRVKFYVAHRVQRQQSSQWWNAIVTTKVRFTALFRHTFVNRTFVVSKFYLDSLLTVSSDFEAYIAPGKVHTPTLRQYFGPRQPLKNNCWKLRFNLSRVGFALEQQVILFTIWTLKPKKKYISS